MINIIVAHCRRRGIGLNNRLPWKLSKDLQYFKDQTIGNGNNAVIMGRKTWESLPEAARPLAERYNIIVSKTIKQPLVTNCKVVSNINEALDYSNSKNFDIVWAIGGAGIYDSILRHKKVDGIYITNIENDIHCDTFFPDIGDNYRLVRTSSWEKDRDLKYRFEVYTTNRSTIFDRLTIDMA
jgi:dihydrofolate reductase